LFVSSSLVHRRLQLPRLDRADPNLWNRSTPSWLTRRQREVLECLCRGHSNRQIARALHIAESTVSVHVTNILRKLNVGSRTEAAVLSHRVDLLND
jgi:DNA-binding NarL/FixJ family response regulator